MLKIQEEILPSLILAAANSNYCYFLQHLWKEKGGSEELKFIYVVLQI